MGTALQETLPCALPCPPAWAGRQVLLTASQVRRRQGTPTVPSTARGYGWRPRDTKCGVWAMDAMWPATFGAKTQVGFSRLVSS